MDRLSLGLTVALVAVGLVMVFVWAVAHFGERAMLKPPSSRTTRRFGMFTIAVGVVMLVVALPLSLASGRIDLMMQSTVQGGLLVGTGVIIYRGFPDTG